MEKDTKENWKRINEYEKKVCNRNLRKYCKNHTTWQTLLSLTKEDVVNTDYFERFSSLFICSQCYKIPTKMFLCFKTQEKFCGPCFYFHKKYNCELCKKYGEKKLDRITSKFISKLEFKCKNNCGKIIKYNDLKNHYFKGCKYEVCKTKPKILVKLDEDEIVNTDYLEELNGEEKCFICKELLFHPYSCSYCCYSFCFTCLRQYMKKETKCPCCKKNFILEKNKTISDLLGELKFRCSYGCGSEIKYDELEDHYLKDCQNIGKVNMNKFRLKELEEFFNLDNNQKQNEKNENLNKFEEKSISKAEETMEN